MKKRDILFAIITAIMLILCSVFICNAEPSCSHELKRTAAKDATDTENGNLEYWTCSKCGKYFCGENGSEGNEIARNSWIISGGNSNGKYDASEIKSVEPIQKNNQPYGLLEEDHGYFTTSSGQSGGSNGNTFSADAKQDVVTVNAGGKATLEVITTGAQEPLHYEWSTYELSDSRYWWEDEKVIAGETGSTLVLNNVDKGRRYDCLVTDNDGNNANVEFYVIVENGFTATAHEQKIVVDQGDDVTLKVDAHADNGNISYIWSANNGQNAISGFKDKASITIRNVSSSTGFTCFVKDRYNNSETVRFNIFVRSEYDNDEIEKIDEIETVYIGDVRTSEGVADRLIVDNRKLGQYEWYKNGVLIENQTLPYLMVSEAGTYRCIRTRGRQIYRKEFKVIQPTVTYTPSGDHTIRQYVTNVDPNDGEEISVSFGGSRSVKYIYSSEDEKWELTEGELPPELPDNGTGPMLLLRIEEWMTNVVTGEMCNYAGGFTWSNGSRVTQSQGRPIEIVENPYVVTINGVQYGLDSDENGTLYATAFQMPPMTYATIEDYVSIKGFSVKVRISRSNRLGFTFPDYKVIDGYKIFGIAESNAQTYAEQYGIDFEAIEETPERALVKARAIAEEELIKYKKDDNYNEEEIEQRNAIVKNGCESIEKATDKTGITNELNSAKALIDKIRGCKHEWKSSYTVDTPATCTSMGSESIHCSKCDAIKEGSSKSILKTAHRYSAWKTTKAATEIAAGQQIRTCSNCGKKETKKIAQKKPTLPVVSISKPAAAKKAAAVKWKKVSKANQKKIASIQIQCSMDKTFKKGVKTTTAKKTAVSKKITKLTSKKTYYVRIRSYKKDKKGVHVSRWSGVKAVKVK